MNLKCIIIDDEQLAIDVLENHIHKVPYLKLAGSFNNGIDALDFIKSNNIDLLFIDIQMPDINGMEFLKLLNKPNNIVFTTAYPEYALEGYDFNPVDYLVKPISFEKFMRAISRVTNVNTPAPIHSVPETEYFYIKVDGKKVRLLLSDILYIEGMKDYVVFYTKTEKLITWHSMKELEQKLPEAQFVRVHKSYIVSIRKIEEVQGSQLKINQSMIPIGRQYKSFILKIIENKKL